MFPKLFNRLFGRPLGQVPPPVPASPARPEAGDTSDGLLIVLIDELSETAGGFRPVLIDDIQNREQAEPRLATLPLVFAWRVPSARILFDINPLPVRTLISQVRRPHTGAFRDLEGRLLAEIRFRATEALAAEPYR